MPFEVEAITPSTTAAPAPIQSMKEERVITPYSDPNRLAKAREKVTQGNDNSQINNSKDRAPAESGKTEETVTLSPQMAALARKEQKFRREQQALKAQKDALEAEKAEIADLKAMKAKLAAKDYSGLDGQVNYDEYTNYLLDKTAKTTPEQEALKKLSSEIENLKNSQQKDVEKRFEAAVNERRTAVKSLVESKPEFKHIKALEQQEAVVQHILNTWENDEIDLSPEQAAQEVEEILKERRQKWLSIEKDETPPVEVDGKKTLPPLKTGIKTLTNNMAGTSEVKKPGKPLHLMTDSERYAEARRRAEEKIKQRG